VSIRIQAHNTPVAQVNGTGTPFKNTTTTWKALIEKKQRALLDYWIKLLELFRILKA
jgi:hypothetical protein